MKNIVMKVKLQRTGLFLLFIVVCFLGCEEGTWAQEQPKLRKDIEWVSKSIEYAALCKQVYSMAWPVVKQKAQTMTRNWVVVLDVDETVLNNVQYAIERTQIDSGFTRQSWTKWVRRQEAPPIPGVKAFLDSVRTLGERAHVAFITNRMMYNEEATIKNLKKYDLFRDGDIMLTRRDRGDSKARRRGSLESGNGRCAKFGPLKIIALFGDNIRDFMPVRGWENSRNYLTEKLPHDALWGTKYFMLPNPTYGPWEREYR